MDAALAFNLEENSLTRRNGGFEVPISGWADGYSWSATVTDANDDPIPNTGYQFIDNGSDHSVRVTGLDDGTTATVTVTAAKTGIALDGIDAADGTALDAALAFNLEENSLTRRNGGFEVPISGWADGYSWSATVTDANDDPIPNTGYQFIDNGNDHSVRVTGLDDGATATVTVTAAKTGVALDGS